MIKIESNPINIVTAMTSNPEEIKNRLGNTNKNIKFTVKIGTFRDAKLSRGDLGNQLFQLTAALAYAWRYDGITLIEKPTIENGIKLNCFELNGVELKENIIPNLDIHEKEFCLRNHKDSVLFLGLNIPESNILQLNGYYQNWRFAKMIEPIVRKCFTFRKTYLDFSNRVIKNIKEKFINHDIIGVHYRGFDQSASSGYHPGSEINHPPIPSEYYKKSFEEMEKCSQKPLKFLIFSNNIKASRKMFENIGYSEKIIFAEDFIDFEDNHKRTDNDILSSFSAPVDLCIFSKCNGHIISNSTFSWWAAWLGNSKNAIAPVKSRWFGDHLSHHNLADLYPPSWKEIWYSPLPESFVTIKNL